VDKIDQLQFYPLEAGSFCWLARLSLTFGRRHTCLEYWWDFVAILGVVFWGDLSVVTSKSRGVCEYHHFHICFNLFHEMHDPFAG
jgi:hypothetical protein